MADSSGDMFPRFGDEEMYRDVFRACLSGLNDEEKCHDLTEEVLESVAEWKAGRDDVQEWQIRDRVIEELEKLGAGIAYFYEYTSYVEAGR